MTSRSSDPFLFHCLHISVFMVFYTSTISFQLFLSFLLFIEWQPIAWKLSFCWVFFTMQGVQVSMSFSLFLFNSCALSFWCKKVKHLSSRVFISQRLARGDKRVRVYPLLFCRCSGSWSLSLVFWLSGGIDKSPSEHQITFWTLIDGCPKFP